MKYNIVELQNATHCDNAYVGYKADILNFLRGQLKGYVEDIPTDVVRVENGNYTCFEDFDLEHIKIVEIASKVIVDICEHANDNSLIQVSDVLYDTMKWNYVSIN